MEGSDEWKGRAKDAFRCVQETASLRAADGDRRAAKGDAAACQRDIRTVPLTPGVTHEWNGAGRGRVSFAGRFQAKDMPVTYYNIQAHQPLLCTCYVLLAYSHLLVCRKRSVHQCSQSNLFTTDRYGLLGR